MIDFTGQVAVVTGAGRGLGRLYALDLARRGASVVVNDLGSSMRGDGADSRVADDVVDEIKKAGGTAIASYDSVDSPAGGQAIIDAAVGAFGRLDAVVSNAGIFGSVPFEDLSVDDWTRMLRVHLDGGFFLSQPAYRAMTQQRGRQIRVHLVLRRDLRPADGGSLRRGESRPSRADERDRDRGRSTRNPRQFRYAHRLLTDGHRDRRRREVPRRIRIHAGHPARTRGAAGHLSGQQRLHVHPPELFGRRRTLRAECSSASAKVGWRIAESEPTAEDIEAHLEQMSATHKFIVPTSIVDEVLEVCERRGVNAMPDNADVAFPEPQRGGALFAAHRHR